MNLSVTSIAIFSALIMNANADIYIPEGNSGTILHLAPDFSIIDRINGVENVHGMAFITSKNLIVAGNLSASSKDEAEKINKPEGMSQAEHDSHHQAAPSDNEAETSIVTFLDAKSHKLVAKIEVPGVVHHVEADQAGHYAVVTHPAIASVSIIDLETRRLVSTLKTGEIPEYAVADPTSGLFYISNAGSKTISEIDPASQKILRTFQLDGGPKHMRLITKLGALAVAEADEGTVSILDLNTGNTVSRFDVGGELHGIESDGDFLYVSAREKDTVVRIGLQNGIKKTVELSEQPYHMTLVGSDLLVSSASDALVWVLNSKNLQIVKTLETADIAHQMVSTQ
ncbi:hypothetical protein FDK21_20505 [Cohaesibacter sp. CAU 1516]|uniref:hypothetical protein n=1 Tax=Cohaesibacter sp. CAU 1516 TaxID=2576038 RepID=UPI0010FE0BAC|nr:hypothetical protein [Cohaesibacter sp. CAU 1516]TLP41780.1 hypothetical protein FDK21_20505 [Cohaesibacter sp. CAU 1516]